MVNEFISHCFGLFLLVAMIMLAGTVCLHVGIRLKFIRIDERALIPVLSRHLAETVLLLALLWGACQWPLFLLRSAGVAMLPVYSDDFPQGGLSHLRNDFAQMLVQITCIGGFLFLGGIVASTRLMGRRTLTMLVAIGWVVWWIDWRVRIMVPYIESIRAAAAREHCSGLFAPELMVPTVVPAVKFAVWGVLAFLSGIFCVRHTFTWKRFAGGSMLGGIFFGWWLNPLLVSPLYHLALQPLVFTLFGCVMIALPLQRGLLERLFGIALRPGAQLDPAPPRSRVAKVLGYAALAFILWLAAKCGPANQSELMAYRILTTGSQPTFRSPAEENAATVLDRVLASVDHAELLAAASPPTENDLAESCILDEKGWSAANSAATTAVLEDNRPLLDALAIAATKDYYEPLSQGDAANRLATLAMSGRMLRLRSGLAVRDGRTTEALLDARTLISLGGLLTDSPSLWGQSIGAILRARGVQTAYDVYVGNRKQPAVLRQLALALDQAAPRARVSLRLDALRRGEPAFLPVAPYIELFLGNYPQIYAQATTAWLNFDALRIAVAVELWRADHGEYPNELQKLVPQYLDRIPLDPFLGRAYLYTVDKGEYRLDSVGRASKESGQEMCRFPPLTAAQYEQEQQTKQAEEKAKTR